MLEKGARPFLNIYEMTDERQGLVEKDFAADPDGWIDFACRCRDGGLEYRQYDVIIGKVADDNVFRVVDLYHNGIWDEKRALEGIRVYPNYDQISFVSQRAVDRMLTFASAEETMP